MRITDKYKARDRKKFLIKKRVFFKFAIFKSTYTFLSERSWLFFEINTTGRGRDITCRAENKNVGPFSSLI